MIFQSTPLPHASQGGADRSTRTTNRPGFAAVPHDLADDRRLAPIDKLLILVLLRYARSKSYCWPSVPTLAQDIDRSIRTVQYALKRLADAGWIASRPASNPTGRVLVLLWRETSQTVAPPPVQSPYSQGMPRTQPVAPKLETKRENEKGALAQRGEEARKLAEEEADAARTIASLSPGEVAAWLAQAVQVLPPPFVRKNPTLTNPFVRAKVVELARQAERTLFAAGGG